MEHDSQPGLSNTMADKTLGVEILREVTNTGRALKQIYSCSLCIASTSYLLFYLETNAEVSTPRLQGIVGTYAEWLRGSMRQNLRLGY